MTENEKRSELQQLLEREKMKLISLMRGRMVPTRKAVASRMKIEELEQELLTLNRQEAERLSIGKEPIEEVMGIVAIPLLADVLVDMVAGVDAMLRRNGAQETVFSTYTRRIRREALAMVDLLAQSTSGLAGLVEVDDTLVDSVKKKLLSFVRQRMNVTK